MTTPVMDDATLATLLVREAGRLARRMRGEGISAEQKTSVSDVVTAADHAAEELVARVLAQERPDDGVLGEEGAARDGSSGRTWVVDPVDGTYNFVQGLDWWCSALALRDDTGVLLGAVHVPETATTYVGGPGRPATVHGSDQTDLGVLDPIVDRPLVTSCVATYLHPPYLGTDVGRAFERAVTGSATQRMTGSGSRDALAIARGHLHAVLHHTVPSWDRLPGEALIRSVGGVTRTVRAAGVDWYVAGVPSAVGEIEAGLTAR